MIDRFGDKTYGFTVSGARILLQAREYRDRSKSPLVTPRTIGLALLDRYQAAFGDQNTRDEVRASLVDWESATRPHPEETVETLQIATARAFSQTGTRAIRDIDLLFSLLAPDRTHQPADPFSFFRGRDDAYPSVFAERVYVAAGGKLRRQHFDSAHHQVALLDLQRADTLQRTGWREFKFIPGRLIDTIPLESVS